MKKKIGTIFSVIAFILSECSSQNAVLFHPSQGYPNDRPDSFYLENITESRNNFLPDWLSAFITGGIEETEKINLYSNDYVFISRNEGDNFIALSKWSENFSVAEDFPRLAAVRIEKRLILAASYIPDEEYGDFFETMVKTAYNYNYPEAVKEETYWLKLTGDIYEFFILFRIDKSVMQEIIKKMMAEALTAANHSRTQRKTINRLQQFFFEGF
jgi:hypothetical protein